MSDSGDGERVGTETLALGEFHGAEHLLRLIHHLRRAPAKFPFLRSSLLLHGHNGGGTANPPHSGTIFC